MLITGRLLLESYGLAPHVMIAKEANANNQASMSMSYIVISHLRSVTLLHFSGAIETLEARTLPQRLCTAFIGGYGEVGVMQRH